MTFSHERPIDDNIMTTQYNFPTVIYRRWEVVEYPTRSTLHIHSTYTPWHI